MEDTNNNQYLKDNEEIKKRINDKLNEIQENIDNIALQGEDVSYLYGMSEIDEAELKSRTEKIKKLQENAEKDKDEVLKTLNEFETLENDIDEIDIKIESKTDEIDMLKKNIQYMESGAAFMNLEADLASGYITQEEYDKEVEKNQNEFEEAKGKIEILTGDIDKLNETKKALLENRKLIKDSVLGKGLDFKENQSQNVETPEIKTPNDEQAKDIEKESISEKQKQEPESKANNDNQFQNNNSKKEQNNNEKQEQESNEEVKQENKAVNNTNGAVEKSEEIDENKIQGEKIENEQSTELQVYKNPNRFLRFFKKIVDKIKSMVKKDEIEAPEEIAEEIRGEMEVEGISSEEINELEGGEKSFFVNELSGAVCTLNEVLEKSIDDENEEINQILEEKDLQVEENSR